MNGVVDIVSIDFYSLGLQPAVAETHIYTFIHVS